MKKTKAPKGFFQITKPGDKRPTVTSVSAAELKAVLGGGSTGRISDSR